MGSRYSSASITIGGQLRRELLAEFLEEVRCGELGTRWGARLDKRIRTPAEVVSLLDAHGHLRLMCEEASGGAFNFLEGWLQDNGMAYDRHSSGDGEDAAVLEMWRAGMEHPVETASSNEEAALIDAGPVIEAHKALRAGDVHGALDLLHRSVGALQNIPTLPPFEIVD